MVEFDPTLAWPLIPVEPWKKSHRNNHKWHYIPRNSAASFGKFITT